MRAEELFRELLSMHQRRIDRMFIYVLLAQWLFGVVLTASISPYTYAGDVATIHFHLKVALGFGALLNAFPITLALTRPGWWFTRHSIAIVQLVWSSLFIMFTNGRIETHFHIFGSLAFVALYRDWRVIVTATLVVLAQHLALENVVLVEHAGWVVFEDVVLLFGGYISRSEMRASARQLADLESANAMVERKVEIRTRALSEAKDRFRALVENIEAVPFEYDTVGGRVLYIAPQASRILHTERAGDVLFGAVVDEDAARVKQTLAQLGDGTLKAASFDYRVADPERQIVHLRVVASARAAGHVQGVALDITKQMNLELELRQAQKLESVGRLAAGVAHEINTPIQFVNDSVRFLQTAVEDVMVVVGKHQQATQKTLEGAPEMTLARAAVDSEAAVDLPFLQTAMPEAIGRAVNGIDRVAAIVRSIKAFAHPDSHDMTNVDLNQAIQSTLLVATSECKYVADVVTDFAKLPDVICHVGEINQVVLNLVVNAAHAIGDAGKRGTITVTTRLVGDSVEISVSDDGAGIPESIRHRVFEPFFTTKDVGKGTGQGLAIAHSVVVDKHHGKLTFESEVGVGTTFVVSLPIDQSAVEVAA
ncbi:MAG: ATP-binding protein [Kofleriaceae bacterium]